MKITFNLTLISLLLGTGVFAQTKIPTSIEYFKSGNVKYELDDYRGAIQDYNKAIELNPKDEIAYYNRGNAKSKLEDYHGAIQDYNKAIELNPNDKDAYNFRGIAKFKLGDTNGACLDFSKAGELGLEKAYEAIKRLCN